MNTDSPIRPKQDGFNARRVTPAFWTVAVAAAIYAAIMCRACHQKFVNFGYADFDLAVHTQSVWNILHGSLASSILGIPFLGNHMVLILFLLAPFYAIFPSPLLLLYTQTIALAAGAFGIWMLARKELSDWPATGLAVIYLIYPPLIYLNLYEFHPVSFAIPLLIWMLWFYKTSKFLPFALCMLLALLCQENIALIMIAFSFYALIERRGKWFYAPFSAGFAYLLFVSLAMPLLNNNTIQFTRLYAHFGDSPPEIMRNIVLHPISVLRFVLLPQKLDFLNAILAPLAYLSLFSPLSLLPALPVVLQRLLSQRASEFSIAYHYQAEFIPFIFFAAIYGIKRLSNVGRRFGRPVAVAGLLVMPVVCLFASGAFFSLRESISPPSPERTLQNTGKDELLRKLPADASVLATFEFLPKLADRSHVYSFHHVYTGRYTFSDVSYPTPRVDFIIFDTQDYLTFSSWGFYHADNYKRIRRMLDHGNWHLFYQSGSLLALERAGSNDQQLPLAFPEAIPAQMNKNVAQWPANAGIQLLGFTGHSVPADHSFDLTLYWSKEVDAPEDYDVSLILKDSGEVVYTGALSPGSRIWPPQSWPAAQTIADRHRIGVSTPISSLENVRLLIRLIPVR
jgi:uncharacterized membrane protein